MVFFSGARVPRPQHRWRHCGGREEALPPAAGRIARKASLTLLAALVLSLNAAESSATDSLSPIGRPPRKPAGEPVVLLHGLAHTSSLMKPLADTLRAEGFRACMIDYPSRKHRIDTLATRFVLPAVRRCFPGEPGPIHFVTHSMGGLVIRRLETLPDAPPFGRVVMIAPPNQGTQVVDRLGLWEPFDLWNGPAARELGTRGSRAIARRLGNPAFEFGVIAGTYSVEPVFSRWLPGPDDGKVSVESTKLPGMRDFIEIHASHTRILRRPETLRQTVAFLKDGLFLHPPKGAGIDSVSRDLGRDSVSGMNPNLD